VALWGAAAIALAGLVSATRPAMHPLAHAAAPRAVRPLARAVRPPAQAATPAVSSQLAHALAHARSFQLTIQATGSGSGQSVAETSTATMVRRGTTLRLHLTTTTRAAGRVSTQEAVLTGTHLCTRASGRGAWSCTAAAGSTLARLQSSDPDQLAAAFGLSQRYEPAGRQLRQGQACLRYQFSLSARGLREQGTLWVARATGLPVEEDTASTLALRAGATPLVVRTTQRWSRWNDPRLSIPPVPAS
jgi:hypothetical protein